MYQDLSMHHGWAVENATVHLPIRLMGNLKHITGNSLDPGTRLLALHRCYFPGLDYICDAG